MGLFSLNAIVARIAERRRAPTGGCGRTPAAGRWSCPHSGSRGRTGSAGSSLAAYSTNRRCRTLTGSAHRNCARPACRFGKPLLACVGHLPTESPRPRTRGNQPTPRPSSFLIGSTSSNAVSGQSQHRRQTVNLNVNCGDRREYRLPFFSDRVLAAAPPPRRAPSSAPTPLEWPRIRHPPRPGLLLALRTARPSRSGPNGRPNQAGCC